jgi:methyl-accepting chemotaxis protein
MHKWSISARLMASFMGLCVCIGALGLASLWAVNGLRDDLGDMSQKILRKSDLAADLQLHTWNLRADMRAFILSTALNRPQDVQAYRGDAEQAFTRLEAALQELNPLLTDEKSKAAAAGIASVLPQWKASYFEVASLAAAGKLEAANKIRNERVIPISKQVEEAPEVIRTGQRTSADQKLAEANQYANSNRWIIVAIIAAGLALGVAVFFIVLNLAGTLRRITMELANGADQVAAASGQIATTSQSLSQGTSEQASAVEEISASMEKMASVATTVIGETAAQVGQSNAALSEMVGSMNSIKTASERVAKINKTIDEIAFQTNILALNAAVEAARAGEAGKGFAVVADEVRNLAQRAAAAAKDTAALIEEAIVTSNQGVLKVELVSDAIRGITHSSGKIKELVGEGSEARGKQAQGNIQQVSIGIQQVNIVTQSNAAAAEESAAAAEELNAQSLTVRELVNRLMLMVDGRQMRPTVFQTAANYAPILASSRPAVLATVKNGAAAHSDEFPMETAESGSFRRF